MDNRNPKFTITTENWDGNHWITIEIIDGMIEVHSSDDAPLDMPYVESAEQWKDAITTRIGMLVAQFLYEIKTKTKNR